VAVIAGSHFLMLSFFPFFFYKTDFMEQLIRNAKALLESLGSYAERQSTCSAGFTGSKLKKLLIKFFLNGAQKILSARQKNMM
jgi:hypothetical protein